MEHNRLRWASRRGMLELDLILQPFVEEDYLSLSSEDKQRFQQLLECEDQDLFTWFMKRGEPEDSEMKAIVKVILDARKP
ncbi:MAG: succinate dehydrogenase assembly factor 2 [Porticoccaceae bacterium]